MTETKETVELAHYGTVRQLLQLQMALFGYTLQRTRTQEHATLERTLTDGLQRLLVVGNHGLRVLHGLLYHLRVFLQRVNMTQHQAGQQHRRETARHGQRLVVGLLRQQQQQDIVLTAVRSQLAVLVAGDVDVGHVLAELVRDVHRTNALGTVARTGKTDEQQRALFVQQVLRMSDQIRRRHGTHVRPYTAHHRLNSIADECRRAGTRQYDVRLRGKVLVHERTNLCLGCQQCSVLLAPHRRLLMNFVVGK